jgi:hypothetical protein
MSKKQSAMIMDFPLLVIFQLSDLGQFVRALAAPEQNSQRQVELPERSAAG